MSVGFNIPINTLYVISESSLSRLSLAPVLRTLSDQTKFRKHIHKITQHKNAPINITKDTKKNWAKRERTDRAGLSRFLRHQARKRNGLFSQPGARRPGAAARTGHQSINEKLLYIASARIRTALSRQCSTIEVA